MPNIQDLLGSSVDAVNLSNAPISDAPLPLAPPPVSEQKRAEVEAEAKKKQLLIQGMPTAEDLRNFGTQSGNSRFQNRPLPAQTEQAYDLATMSPIELRAKYGVEHADRLTQAAVEATSAYTGRTNPARSAANLIGDVVPGGIYGAYSGLGKVATIPFTVADLALNAIGVKSGMGSHLAESIKESDDWVDQKVHSPGYRVAQERANNDSAFTDAVTQRWKDDTIDAGGNKWTTGARAIGKNAGDAVTNTIDNPAMLIQGIAEMFSSMGTSGFVAKGLSKLAAKPLLKAAEGAAEKTATKLAEKELAELGEKVLAEGGEDLADAAGLTLAEQSAAKTTAFLEKKAADDLAKAAKKAEHAAEERRQLASIALQEVGGTVSDTEAQARESGASYSDASKAGAIAGAIDLPIALITGKLAAKAEVNPFKTNGVRNAAKNILVQGGEETPQSGGGQFAQNVGMSTINPDQDLTEGVGTAAGQGGLFGMAGSGVLQGPTAVAKTTARGTIGAGKLALKGAGAGIGAAAGAFDKAMATREAAAEEKKTDIIRGEQTKAQQTTSSGVDKLQKAYIEHLKGNGPNPFVAPEAGERPTKDQALVMATKALETVSKEKGFEDASHYNRIEKLADAIEKGIVVDPEQAVRDKTTRDRGKDTSGSTQKAPASSEDVMTEMEASKAFFAAADKVKANPAYSDQLHFPLYSESIPDIKNGSITDIEKYLKDYYQGSKEHLAQNLKHTGEVDYKAQALENHKAALAKQPNAKTSTSKVSDKYSQQKAANEEGQREAQTELFDAIHFDPNSDEVKNSHPTVQKAVAGVADRFTALRRVADAIIKASKDGDTAAVAHLSGFLEKTYATLKNVVDKGVPKAISHLDPTDDAQADTISGLENYRDTVSSLLDHVDVVKAKGLAREQLKTTTAAQAVENADSLIDIAANDPGQVSLDTLNVILEHSKSGKRQLSPERLATLQAAAAMARAIEKHSEKYEKTGASPGEHVSANAAAKRTQPYARREKPKTPALDHAIGVYKAWQAGDTELAQQRLDDMRLFALSMGRKVDAINQSGSMPANLHGEERSLTYKPVSPDRKTPGKGKNFKSKPLWYDPRVPASVLNAKRVAIDAQTVTQLYNGLTQAFDEDLTGEPIPTDSLVIDAQIGEGKPGKPTAPTPPPKKMTAAEYFADQAAKILTPKKFVGTFPNEGQPRSNALITPDGKIWFIGETTPSEFLTDMRLETGDPTIGSDYVRIQVGVKSAIASGSGELTKKQINRVASLKDAILRSGRNFKDLDGTNTIAGKLAGPVETTPVDEDEGDQETDEAFVEAAEEVDEDRASKEVFAKETEHYDGLDTPTEVLMDIEGKTDQDVLFQGMPNDTHESLIAALKILEEAWGPEVSKLARDIVGVWLRPSSKYAAAKPTVMAFTSASVIALSADLFDRLAKKPGYALQLVTSALARLADAHATDGDSIESSRGTKGKDDEGNTVFTTKFGPKGEIYDEFLQLKDKKRSGVYQPDFDRIEQAFKQGRTDEFFAELGTFVLMNQALAKRVIPNGTKAFLEIYNQALEARGYGKIGVGKDGTADGSRYSSDGKGGPTRRRSTSRRSPKGSPNTVDTVRFEDNKALTWKGVPVRILTKDEMQPGEMRVFKPVGKAISVYAFNYMNEAGQIIAGTYRLIGDTLTDFVIGSEDGSFDPHSEAMDGVLARIQDFHPNARYLYSESLYSTEQTDRDVPSDTVWNIEYGRLTDSRVTAASQAEEAASAKQFQDNLPGTPIFKSAYITPRTLNTKSRLRGFGDAVITTIQRVINGETGFNKIFEGIFPEDGLPAEIDREYQRLLDLSPDLMEALNVRLQTLLDKPFKGGTLKQLLLDKGMLFTNHPATWRHGKVLNIAENTMTEDGEEIIRYIPELTELSIAATFQFLVDTLSRPMPPLDRERVGKILQKDEIEVTPQDLYEASQGMSFPTAVDLLAKSIIDFWGVTTNRDMPEGMVQGIAEAVAKEILETLNTAPYFLDKAGKGAFLNIYTIDKNSKRVADDPGAVAEGNKFIKIEFSKDARVAKQFKMLRKYPTAIRDVVLHEKDQPYFVNSMPGRSSKTYLRSPVKLSEAQHDNQENEGKTIARVNTSGYTFYLNLGMKMSLLLLGEGNIDDKKMNINDRRSKQGRNLGIEGALQTLFDIAGEAAIHAKDGKSLSDIAIRFAYATTKVGRVIAKGSYTHQSSKPLRETVTTTLVTLDMNQEVNKTKFMLAVAQGTGEKIHKQDFETSIRKTNDKIATTLSGAVAVLTKHLDGQFLDIEDVAILKKSLESAGIKRSDFPHAIHSLMEYARATQAIDAKTQDKFQTDLYVEADGVANGITNALYHLATGEFNLHWLSMMRKGGLFINLGDQNFTDYVLHGNNIDTTHADDAYVHMGNRAQTHRVEHRRKMATQSKEAVALAIQMDELVRLTIPTAYYNKLTGKVEFNRDGVKNPATVIIYGSSQGGVADTITADILSAYYEQMTTVANLEEQARKAKEADRKDGSIKDDDWDLLDFGNLAAERETLDKMTSLINQLTMKSAKNDWDESKGRKQWQVTPTGIKNPIKPMNLEEFTLDPDRAKHLASNVQYLFSAPMVSAIMDVIKDTHTGRESMMKAGSIQSIFFKQAFVKAIRAKMDEKKLADPKYKEANLLSRNELDKIFNDLLEEFPYIKAAHQSFFPGGTENSYLKAESFAETTDKKYTTRPRIFGPGKANVATIPHVVQGTGDGYAMMYLSNMEDAPEGTLKIFDGVHLRLSSLFEDAMKANQAIDASWDNAPLVAVNTAFQQFAAYASTDGKTIDELWELMEGFYANSQIKQFRDNGMGLTDLRKEINESMATLKKQLMRAAVESEARHLVIKEDMQTSIDQMAGTGQAYVKNRDKQQSFDKEENLKDYMNGLLRQKIKQLLPRYEAEALALKERTDKIKAKKAEADKKRAEQIAAMEAAMEGRPVKTEEELLEDEISDNWDPSLSAFDPDKVHSIPTNTAGDSATNMGTGGTSISIVTPTAEVLDEPNHPIPASMEKVASIDATTKVRIIQAKDFQEMAAGLTTSPHQSSLINEVTKALANSGWTIVVGPKRNINAYARNKNALVPTSSNNGYISLNEKTIYLNNPTGEVTLHELVHAAVAQVIFEYLINGKATAEVKQAIDNLTGLMTEWLDGEQKIPGDIDKLKISLADKTRLKDSYRAARALIEGYGTQANRSPAESLAVQLNEFMAWNLANQNLIQVLQQTSVQNPLLRITKKVLETIAKLAFPKAQFGSAARNDFYSALRFNTTSLINSQSTLPDKAYSQILEMSTVVGDNERLANIEANIADKLYAHLNSGSNLEQITANQANIKARIIAQEIANDFDVKGFPFKDVQTRSVFETLVASFVVGAKMDGTILSQMQELYSYVMNNLPKDAFVDRNNPNRDQDAKNVEEKKTLRGVDVTRLDPQNRSTYLASFVALAITNDDLRAVLEKMPVPKNNPNSIKDLNSFFDYAGIQFTDTLAKFITGQGNSANIKAAIDALSYNMMATTQNRQNLISQVTGPAGSIINTINDLGATGIQKAAEFTSEKLKAAQTKVNSPSIKAFLGGAALITMLIDETNAANAAEGLLSIANTHKIPLMFKDAMIDIIGRTESNAPVFDMIKKVRHGIQRIRQQFVEYLPGKINAKFKTPLTEEQSTHAFHGIAKTDMAILRIKHSTKEILQMMRLPSRVNARIATYEASLKKAYGDDWDLVQSKAKQLANQMNTGIQGEHLLRNAFAVSNLSGLGTTLKVTRPVTQDVDTLITLYAMQGLSKPVLETMAHMAENEPEGTMFMLSYLVGQRKDELAKLETKQAKLNHWKGYIPSIPKGSRSNVQMMVAEDAQEAEMKKLGYVKTGPYLGSRAEYKYGRTYSYYVSPVAGEAAFLQGNIQNVRTTAAGVDPITGYSYDVRTAGQILDPETVARIIQKSNSQKDNAEPLMPLFGDDNNIIGFERSINPDMLKHLHLDTNISRMIGVWRGRQMEEQLAVQMNAIVIERLGTMYKNAPLDKDKDGSVHQYEDLYKSKDPIVRDALRLMNREAREFIEQQFGKGVFMVRRDLINDTIGYRGASVGDLWTGNTRLHPDVVKVARGIAEHIAGDDAFKMFTTGERVIQNVVQDLKHTIIVRSVSVPISNMISNVYQMAGLGVSPIRMLTDAPKKVAEVSHYAKRRLREIDLEMELRAATGDSRKIAAINAELKQIADANSLMSIWPLIEAGELTAISDAGVLDKQEVGTLWDGKWVQYFEKLVDDLPQPFADLGKYFLITPDTSLFRGMTKALEYGDFVAKAILHDHLMEAKNKKAPESLATVSDTFVHYDRLPGRVGSYLDSVGVLWFFKYKMRIAKVALSSIRDNPFHALLTSLIPQPEMFGNIGSPQEDNFFTKLWDGSIWRAVGPGMGLNAPWMNPYMNILK